MEEILLKKKNHQRRVLNSLLSSSSLRLTLGALQKSKPSTDHGCRTLNLGVVAIFLAQSELVIHILALSERGSGHRVARATLVSEAGSSSDRHPDGEF